MISEKLLWFVVVQFAILEGFYCFNTTQKIVNEIAQLNTTTEATSPDVEKFSHTSKTPVQNNTLQEPASVNSKTVNETKLKILEIFHGYLTLPTLPLPTEEINVNSTTLCLNATFVNLTCTDRSWNDTFKANYTMLAEAAGSTEGFPAFRLSNTAAIAAGVFLVSAVIGYISCVGYRRIKQRKYGNSQILIGEEVYDTADLRYFEI